MVEQGKVEVAGNGEDIVDPHLDQSARKVATEGSLTGGGRWGGGDRVASNRRRRAYRAVGGGLYTGVDGVDLSVHGERLKKTLEGIETEDEEQLGCIFLGGFFNGE